MAEDSASYSSKFDLSSRGSMFPGDPQFVCSKSLLQAAGELLISLYFFLDGLDKLRNPHETVD